MSRPLLAAAALLLAALPAAAQKQFGFDNRKASGQPYLTPAESLKRITQWGLRDRRDRLRARLGRGTR